MKGYKVFEPDWTCRGYQYKVGKTFKQEGKPKCCVRGFHFCTRLVDCFRYYPFDPDIKVAEVEAFGDIDSTDNKHCTNKIKIIRELSWEEVLKLINIGIDSNGVGNVGNFNAGNYNCGACNYGSHNSGDFNFGLYNTGDYNKGNYNTGHFNIGNWNTGNNNIGNDNTGDYNIGNYNTGDWNKTGCSSGCFNTEKDYIKLFNKISNWTLEDWYDSEARCILSTFPEPTTEWITGDNMTEEEKKEHPEYKVTKGYLKILSISKEEAQNWWDNSLNDCDRETILNLPNFDTTIFEEITGVKVN